jgi:hypothetical protein
MQVMIKRETMRARMNGTADPEIRSMEMSARFAAT